MNVDVILASLLGLFGLWYLVLFRWPEYRLDSFRDDIFRLRDNMFLFAAKDGISFEDPAYTILRERMNVLIRYAHEFTLTRLLIAGVTQDLPLKSPAIVQWEAAVAELPKPTREVMEEYNKNLAFAVVKQLVFSSLLLYVIFLPTTSIIKALKVVDVKREVVSNPQVVSKVEALESGALEQDALVGKAHASATA